MNSTALIDDDDELGLCFDNSLSPILAGDKKLPSLPSKRNRVPSSDDKKLPSLPSKRNPVPSSDDKMLPSLPPKRNPVSSSENKKLPPLPSKRNPVPSSDDKKLPSLPSNRNPVPSSDNKKLPPLPSKKTCVPPSDNERNHVPSSAFRKQLVKQVMISSSATKQKQKYAPANKRSVCVIDVDSCYSNKSWVPELGLLWEDKEILLCDSSWLNDRHINAAQRLLEAANPNLPGFQNPLFGQTLSYDIEPGEFVQILHDGGGHWLTVSTVGTTHPYINVFDSLYSFTSPSVKLQIASMLCTQQKEIITTCKDVQLNARRIIRLRSFHHCFCHCHNIWTRPWMQHV